MAPQACGVRETTSSDNADRHGVEWVASNANNYHYCAPCHDRTATRMRLNDFMHRYGTPLTAGLFTVSAVSGVALFFHWAPRTFHAMHEWLSMLLLAPFVLHLVKNWKPLVAYAKRRTLLVPIALSLLAAVPFALTAGKGRAANPVFQTVTLMTQASLADLAPVLQASPEELLRHLQQQGYQAASTGDTVAAIAAASQAKPNDVLYAMLPGRRVDKPARS